MTKVIESTGITRKPLYPPHIPPYLTPKPKRPWRNKKMTIAAGFVCSDGLILCADTQETIMGYTKNSTEKIRFWGDGGLGIAITGAGDTDLIETIGAEIEDALVREYAPDEIRWTEEVRKIIQQTMSSAFAKYIKPWETFPRDDRPSCELLILVTVDNEVNNYSCLFKATGTLVREITYGAECIGTGLILAKSLIERFFSSFMHLDEAILAALYVMHQTKKWVDGCGGNTDAYVASVGKKIFTGFSSLDIKRIEEQFDRQEDALNGLTVNLLNPHRGKEYLNRTVSTTLKSRNDDLAALYPAGSHLAVLFGRVAPKRIKRSKPRKSKGQP